MDVGRIFDILGVFQQIFIHLLAIIEKNIQSSVRHSLLVDLKKGNKSYHFLKHNEYYPDFEIYQDFERIFSLFLPQIDLEHDSIDFSEAPAQKIW